MLHSIQPHFDFCIGGWRAPCCLYRLAVICQSRIVFGYCLAMYRRIDGIISDTYLNSHFEEMSSTSSCDLLFSTLKQNVNLLIAGRNLVKMDHAIFPFMLRPTQRKTDPHSYFQPFTIDYLWMDNNKTNANIRLLRAATWIGESQLNTSLPATRLQDRVFLLLCYRFNCADLFL